MQSLGPARTVLVRGGHPSRSRDGERWCSGRCAAGWQARGPKELTLLVFITTCAPPCNPMAIGSPFFPDPDWNDTVSGWLSPMSPSRTLWTGRRRPRPDRDPVATARRWGTTGRSAISTFKPLDRSRAEGLFGDALGPLRIPRTSRSSRSTGANGVEVRNRASRRFDGERRAPWLRQGMPHTPSSAAWIRS